jgi:hypothetical protein
VPDAADPSTPDSGLAGGSPSARVVDQPGPQASTALRIRRLQLHDLRLWTAAAHQPDRSGLQVRDHRRQRRVHDRTAVIGASNALRERAWDPQSLWGWADPLVEQATRRFTRRSSASSASSPCHRRLLPALAFTQADMGAPHDGGWAILVMVAVTAIAAWPVRPPTSRSDLDHAPGVSTMPSARGLTRRRQVRRSDPALRRQPAAAVRASDTRTETMLYRNWLAGFSARPTAKPRRSTAALYDARSLTGTKRRRSRQPRDSRRHAEPQERPVGEGRRADQAGRPEAYEYLQGVNGMDRIGAGFIAVSPRSCSRCST